MATEVTRILSDLAAGDDTAAARLLDVIYLELHARAEQVMVGQPAQTLQPTALVHEAWMRLAGPAAGDFESRGHFVAVAAKAMRQILVDRARRRAAQKRGGDGAARGVAIGSVDSGPDAALDVVDLQDALARLEIEHPRCARIAELRFFGGLEVVEVARVLGASERTVYNDWRFARAWLRRAMEEKAAP